MPYVTLVGDGVTPSAIPAFNAFHHNFLVSNYGADGGCLDTDDGSAFYHEYSSFGVFCGSKSDFDGHSKRSEGNLHAYAMVYGPSCKTIGAQILPMSGYPDIYANNTCIQANASNNCINLGQSSKGFPNASTFQTQMLLSNNTFYVPNGSCGSSGTPFATYAELTAAGYEAFPSVISGDMPSSATIIEWAKQKLNGAQERNAHRHANPRKLR